MRVTELVDKAGENLGSLGELAKALNKHPSRISEWKNGKRKPDASEIAYMAKVAGLPVLITLAMVEKDLHPETAQLWDTALGEVDARVSQGTFAFPVKIGGFCAAGLA